MNNYILLVAFVHLVSIVYHAVPIVSGEYTKNAHVCTNVKDDERVDCLPNSDKESCTLKGCCWNPMRKPGPWCFYPQTNDMKNICANIPDTERIDCLRNSNRESCTAKGCCWQEKSTPGPWCFHPKLQYNPPDLCLDVPEKEKVDCLPKYYADETSCVAKGCCWLPKIGSEAWCFHPRSQNNISHECSAVPEKEKDDCHPLPGATEEACAKKGCCWLRKTGPGPWCFYSKPQYNPPHVCAAVPEKERVDCLAGATEEACINKGCCWLRKTGPGPWCFYSKPQYYLQSICSAVPEGEKDDCHPLPGATEEACTNKGCCWLRKTEPGPWCFYPKQQYNPPHVCSAVPEREKVDCHSLPGATEEACAKKGCCWLRKTEPGPWCFYPKTFDFQNVCSQIRNEDKVDCFKNAEEKDCISKGCCWRTQPGPGPWCFYPNLISNHTSQSCFSNF